MRHGIREHRLEFQFFRSPSVTLDKGLTSVFCFVLFFSKIARVLPLNEIMYMRVHDT